MRMSSGSLKIQTRKLTKTTTKARRVLQAPQSRHQEDGASPRSARRVKLAPAMRQATTQGMPMELNMEKHCRSHHRQQFRCSMRHLRHPSTPVLLHVELTNNGTATAQVWTKIKRAWATKEQIGQKHPERIHNHTRKIPLRHKTKRQSRRIPFRVGTRAGWTQQPIPSPRRPQPSFQALLTRPSGPHRARTTAMVRP